MRRCMKYGDRTAEMPSQDINIRKGTLREECFLFILSHSYHSDSLLGFIDELFDGARFRTLESNLQSLMLSHLADLLKIFSNSRVAKLFDDISDFLRWFVSSDQHNEEEKISMRVSCWKSLHICLSESAAIQTQDYAYNLEQCMEVLFTMLPWSRSSVNTELYRKNSNTEWAAAIRCLGKAQQGWLLKFLLVMYHLLLFFLCPSGSYYIYVCTLECGNQGRYVQIFEILSNLLSDFLLYPYLSQIGNLYFIFLECAITRYLSEGKMSV